MADKRLRYNKNADKTSMTGIIFQKIVKILIIAPVFHVAIYHD